MSIAQQKQEKELVKKPHAGCLAHDDHDRCFVDFDLLSPLYIRELQLRNRIVMSPMCQYSATDGLADDWHLVHLGSRAVGGAGLIFAEATAVTAQGRISPKDLGLWNEEQIKPLQRITAFIHRMGAKAGIQLAHAGRKGSCEVPWQGGSTLKIEQGGWNVVGPSPIPFSDHMPHELNKEEIQTIINAFKDAASRAIEAEFDVIEVHAAHGYLLHEFLSPISNKRSDEYGGSLENRMHFLCETVQAIRSVIPESMPLFVRISATDWVERGWDLEQSIELAKHLGPLGVDLIDVSSGGSVKHASIPVGKNYQVPFAAEIRKCAHILTGAVGLITDSQQANEIITSGQADLVFIGRELLRDPYWALKAEQTLNQDPHWPIPYGYAVKRHS